MPRYRAMPTFEALQFTILVMLALGGLYFGLWSIVTGDPAPVTQASASDEKELMSWVNMIAQKLVMTALGSMSVSVGTEMDVGSVYFFCIGGSVGG